MSHTTIIHHQVIDKSSTFVQKDQLQLWSFHVNKFGEQANLPAIEIGKSLKYNAGQK